MRSAFIPAFDCAVPEFRATHYLTTFTGEMGEGSHLMALSVSITMHATMHRMADQCPHAYAASIIGFS